MFSRNRENAADAGHSLALLYEHEGKTESFLMHKSRMKGEIPDQLEELLRRACDTEDPWKRADQLSFWLGFGTRRGFVHPLVEKGRLKPEDLFALEKEVMRIHEDQIIEIRSEIKTAMNGTDRKRVRTLIFSAAIAARERWTETVRRRVMRLLLYIRRDKKSWTE